MESNTKPMNLINVVDKSSEVDCSDFIKFLEWVKTTITSEETISSVSDMGDELDKMRNLGDILNIMWMVSKHKFSRTNTTYKSLEKILFRSLNGVPSYGMFEEKLKSTLKVLFFLWTVEVKTSNKNYGMKVPMLASDERFEIFDILKKVNKNTKVFGDFEEIIEEHGNIGVEGELDAELNSLIKEGKNEDTDL